MAQAEQDRRIDYIEFTRGQRGRGTEGRRDGGRERQCPLVVIYALDLAGVERSVIEAGGEVVDHIEFPGGKRFHFLDLVGNRLAVWSDH
jgi:predicted enzyme related to lactoylglutathione lyase